MKPTLLTAVRGVALMLMALAVQGAQDPEPLCTDCAPLRLQATQTLSTLTGCYWAGNSVRGTLIRVQRVAENVYRLDTDKGAAVSGPVTLHTAEWQDVKAVSKGFGMELDDGITATDNKFTNANPVGIYRGRDAGGKPVVLAYLLFFNGNLEPAPCT